MCECCMFGDTGRGVIHFVSLHTQSASPTTDWNCLMHYSLSSHENFLLFRWWFLCRCLGEKFLLDCLLRLFSSRCSCVWGGTFAESFPPASFWLWWLMLNSVSNLRKLRHFSFWLPFCLAKPLLRGLPRRLKPTKCDSFATDRYLLYPFAMSS